MKRLLKINLLAVQMPSRLFILFGGFIVLSTYLWISWIILDPHEVWSPDEGAKLIQLMSFRSEARQVKIDILYLGRSLDPRLTFALADHPKDLLSIVDGSLYFQRLPLFPFLSWPFFRLFGIYGLYLIPAFSAAAIAFLALHMIDKQDRRLAMWVLIAFGSPVLVYATIFWEHTLATCLGLAGMWIVLHISSENPYKQRGKILLSCLAALLFSIAIYLRLELGLLAAGLFISVWHLIKNFRKEVVLMAIIVAISLLAYQPLHQALFEGKSTPVNTRYLIRPFAYLRSAQWQAIPDLIVGPNEDEGIDPGWLGAVWVTAAVVAVAHSTVSNPTTTTKTLVQCGLGLSCLVGGYFLFTGSPYRAAHGLLFTTPWAILGLTRAKEVWESGKQRAKVIILTYLVGLAVYTVIMIGVRGSSPHGGLEWGARFFLSFYPLLGLISAWDWRGKNKIEAGIIIILICLGIGYEARGIHSIRKDKQINASLNHIIMTTPEEHVISDLWWFFLNSGPITNQKALYAAASPQEIGEWIDLASNQGIENFDLVTLDNKLPNEIESYLSQNSISIIESFQIENLYIYRISIK